MKENSIKLEERRVKMKLDEWKEALKEHNKVLKVLGFLIKKLEQHLNTAASVNQMMAEHIQSNLNSVHWICAQKLKRFKV